MKCSICGKELEPGEQYALCEWLIKRRGYYGGDRAAFYEPQRFCSEHIPGHVKRAAAGITHITGAARLGVQEGSDAL
jgi:hypothetical protein